MAPCVWFPVADCLLSAQRSFYQPHLYLHSCELPDLHLILTYITYGYPKELGAAYAQTVPQNHAKRPNPGVIQPSRKS